MKMARTHRSMLNAVIDHDPKKKDVFVPTHSSHLGFVDGPCGSGKSYALVQSLKTELDTHGVLKCIIAVPTLKLASQLFLDLKNTGIDPSIIFKIDSSTTNSVLPRFMDAYREAGRHDACLMIITHHLLNEIPMNLPLSHWDLYVDEIPQIDEFIKFTLPRNHHIISPYFGKPIEYSSSLYELPGNLKMIDKYKINQRRSNDSIDEMIQSLIESWARGQRVFIDRKQYEKIIVNQSPTTDQYNKTTKGKESNDLPFLIMTKPDRYTRWKSCTIIGANFKSSMMYDHFKEVYGIDWKERVDISKHLRFHEHADSNRLEILYIQDAPPSKYKFRKTNAAGQSMLSMCYDGVKEFFGADPVLIGINNEFKNTLHIDSNHTVVPLVSHGLNHWVSYNNLAILYALNREPLHARMLDTLGYDRDALLRFTLIESVYQMIMRSAMRNPDSSTSIRVVITDKMSAEHLRDHIFPNADVRRITDEIIDIPEPVSVVPMTNTERQHASRLKAIQEQMKIESDEDSLIDFSLFKDLYSPTILVGGSQSVPSIASTMKKYYTNNSFRNKKDNGLINFNRYNEEELELDAPNHFTRMVENVRSTSAIVFDIEDGDLNPEQARSLFRDTIGVSNIMYSTASHTNESPRYRIIVFPDQSMNHATYDTVYDYLLKRIEQYGFYTIPSNQRDEYRNTHPHRKLSGIDLSKRNLSSAFYLPGRLIGQADTFFCSDHCVDNNHRLNIRLILEDSVRNPIPFVVPKKSNKDMHASSFYTKIIDMIDLLRPGDRSYLACQIGGWIHQLRSDDMTKRELIEYARTKGIDKSAMKSIEKYAFRV